MVTAGRLDVVLIRHGLTAWNRERRYLGHHDVDLLPEADDALGPLRTVLAKETFDAIYCSDLKRCRQTLARLRAKSLPVSEPHWDTRLRELDFGAYEGQRYEDLQYDGGYRAWIDSQGDQAPPGGESAAAFHGRVDAFMDELLARAGADGHRRVLVVTHGGVIRSLRMHHERIDFWAGGIGHGAHYTLSFAHQGER